MRLFYSDKFLKSIPREKKKHLDKFLIKFNKELLDSNSGIFSTTRGSQTIKFKGVNHVFKFRISDGDRIIFTYSNMIKNIRAGEDDGIYLIYYNKNHDEQDRNGRKAGKRKQSGFKELNFDKETISIEECDDDETKQYDNYLDMDNAITYTIEFANNNKSISEAVRINSEQYECVLERSPLLLSGGAGSGKTLVSIHKANAYRSCNGKVAYFTLSQSLCRNAQKVYMEIKASEEEVLFSTLHDYCVIALDLSETSYVTFERFHKWLSGRKLPIDIEPINVWEEIRGIIKGYMGPYWQRNYVFYFNDYNEISNKYLKKKGFIKEEASNGRYLRSTLKSYNEFVDALSEISIDPEIKDSNQIADDLKSIYNNTMKFKYETVDQQLIPQSDYLSIDDKTSVYTTEERKAIYSIAMKYQNWIKKEEFYDDNDIAAKLICFVQNNEFERFDYIVVDEVQDFTELEIYLISILSKNLNQITFAGDIHQIINPTYYTNERLTTFYRTKAKEIKLHQLEKNYRSSKNIVELAEIMSGIRRRMIGCYKEETEQPLKGIKESSLLYNLKPTGSNLKGMLYALQDRAYTAIITANEKDKERLESVVGIPLKNVFTIQEAKGLEFKYVFCYNLTSNYADKWKEIFDGKARKNSKYRYFFNIFYVAITRAIDNLCIYEDINVFSEDNVFLSIFADIDSFDAQAVGLAVQISDKSEWLAEGKKLESTGKLKNAKLYYEKAKSQKDVLRCKYKMDFEAGMHNEAIDSLIEISEFEIACEYSKRIKNYNKQVLSFILSGKRNYKSIDNEFGSKFVMEVLSHEVKDIRYSNKIYENYVLPKIDKAKGSIASATDLLGKVVENYGQ